MTQEQQATLLRAVEVFKALESFTANNRAVKTPHEGYDYAQLANALMEMSQK